MVDDIQLALTTASGLISLAIGIYVFLKGRRQLANKLFFLMTIFLAIWALGEAMTLAATDLGWKIFWTKFQGVGEMPLIPTYLMIALYFPRVRKPMRDRKNAAIIITALYAPWLVGMVLLYTTNVFYSSYFLTEYGQGVNVARTPAFWVLTVLGFGEIIFSSVLFMLERKRSATSFARKGLLVLALAPLPMLVANAIQNLEVNRSITTPQASIIFVLMLAYGIMRYGLFADIRRVTKGLLVNAAVIIVNFTLFSSLCVLYIFGMGLGMGWVTYCLFVVTGIPFMLAYNAEVSWTKRFVNRYIYGRELEESRLLQELGRSIRTVSNLNELAWGVVDKVRDSMGLFTCILMQKDGDVYRALSYANDPKFIPSRFNDMMPKGSCLRKFESFFSGEDGEGHFSGYWEFKDKMIRAGCELVYIRFAIMRIIERGRVLEYEWREDKQGEIISVPLEVGGEEIGLLWLGGRKSGAGFSLEELDLIATLSAQVAISLQNAELMQELLDKSTRLQALIQISSTAQEEERIRIARELHDGLASYFLDAIFKLDMLEAQASGLPSVIEAVDELKDEARLGLRDLRRVLGDLRPSSLDVLGLEKSLYTYLERFAAENGLKVGFRASGDLNCLESLAEVTVFRVAQEALSNIARHANAVNITFSLSGDDGWVEMIIEDDGVGFVEKEVGERIISGECLGIKGMKERAELMQGELVIDSSPGNGTRIVFSIPVSHAREEALDEG
jgi:signal transduction histidine kinase